MSNPLSKSSRIYIAGHRGLVGSALVRHFEREGHRILLLQSKDQLDLRDPLAVNLFFDTQRPDYVILAAAKVGGIVANNTMPADFIEQNLAIQYNVLKAAREHNVERLLFLGSSCIYPKHCSQPIKEEYLLGGPLEPTNRPYAIAKIAGIETCWAYNRQYGTDFLAAMPTNLYGPGDNYHPTQSHVIPALFRKMHEAQETRAPYVTLWGTGEPRREFLHSDDLARACVMLLRLPENKFSELTGSADVAPLLNIGSGEDVTIRELATMIADTVGYKGELRFDPSMPDGTPRKLLDITKIRALGWEPQIDLQSGLRATLEDFLAKSI